MSDVSSGSSKKPLWKRWWFVALGAFVVLGAIGGALGDPPADEDAGDQMTTTATAVAAAPAEVSGDDAESQAVQASETATDDVVENESLVSAGCRGDMAVAAAVSDLEDTASDLWPTFTSCTSVEEWKAAAIEAGESERIGVDSWVPNQCAYEPAVADTPLCRSLPPTPEPDVETFLVTCPDGIEYNIVVGFYTADEAIEIFC